MSPLWLEDFAEWFTTADVDTYTGTFWSAGAIEPTIQADTNFHSGKAMACTGNDNTAFYTLPVAPSVAPFVLQMGMVRTADSNIGTGLNSAYGFGLVFGTDQYIRVTADDGAAGFGNRYVLQSRNGAAGTFLQVASSPNIYPIGVRTDMALEYDWGAQQVRWYINEVLIYSGAMPFNTPPLSTMWSRMGTSSSSWACRFGDIFAYDNSNYVGIREIRTGVPIANGVNQDWTVTGPPNAWEAVDGIYTVTVLEWIEAAASGEISDFECPIDNTNVGLISAVALRYRALRTDVLPVDMEGRLGDQDITYTAGAVTQPPAGAYQTFADYWGLINPNTGLAWAAADLADLFAGVERSS